MSKAYILYDQKDGKEVVIATAPNLKDVLGVGSRMMEDAIMRNTRRPDFRVMACTVDSNFNVAFEPVPVDLKVGAKIVYNGDISAA